MDDLKKNYTFGNELKEWAFTGPWNKLRMSSFVDSNGVYSNLYIFFAQFGFYVWNILGLGTGSYFPKLKLAGSSLYLVAKRACTLFMLLLKKKNEYHPKDIDGRLAVHDRFSDVNKTVH